MTFLDKTLGLANPWIINMNNKREGHLSIRNAYSGQITDVYDSYYLVDSTIYLPKLLMCRNGYKNLSEKAIRQKIGFLRIPWKKSKFRIHFSPNINTF